LNVWVILDNIDVQSMVGERNHKNRAPFAPCLAPLVFLLFVDKYLI